MIPVRNIRIKKPFVLSDYYSDERSGVTGPKGAFCFIDRQELCAEAKKLYGRENDNLCLKIFYSKPLWGRSQFSEEIIERETVEEHRWNDQNSARVLDATRIQNICAWEGYAPLVRALLTVEWDDRICLAQLTEDAGLMYVMEAEDRPTIEESFGNVKKISEEWGYTCDDQELNDGNFWGGGKREGGKSKWLDFQDFKPVGETYERAVRDLVLKECQHFSVPLYQTIPPLTKYFAEKDVKGWRDCAIRFKDFGLDKYDWTNKTVVDFGADNGMMLYECHKAGALRGVGIEPEHRVGSMKHIANYIGNWNADFYGFDLKGATTENLKQLTGFDGFDVVLFLAMGNHVGHFEEYIRGVCKDMLIYEKNMDNEITIPQTIDELKKMGFSKVEFIGQTKEANNREVVVAKR